MSLLADLLSKLKHEGRKGDVPPRLKSAVETYSQKESARKRLLIPAFVVLLAVAAGFITVYVMERYIKPSFMPGAQAPPSRLADLRKNAEIKPSEPSPAPAPEVKIEKKEEIKPAPGPQAAKNEKPQEKPAGKDERAAVPVKKTEKAHAPAGRAKSRPVSGPADEGSAAKQRTGGTAPTALLPVFAPPAQAQQAAAPKDRSEIDNYIYQARTYESIKNYRQALLYYKKAAEYSAGNHVILNNIAAILIRLGIFDEAVKYASDALRISPDYVPALVNNGVAHIRLGKPEEGERYLMKGLSAEPENRQALLNLGILYEKQGLNKMASESFSKLASAGDLQGYLGMARLYEDEGKAAEAVGVYNNILNMNGVDSKVKGMVNDRLQFLRGK